MNIKSQTNIYENTVWKMFNKYDMFLYLHHCHLCLFSALDISVSLMNVGETAQIIAGFKHMYGEQGL